jgi:chitodextrinase
MNYLTAGTLEIKGNVTQRQYNSPYGFYASGTHKTILSGNSLQTVNFASIESKFNILELTKDFDLGYRFNRNPMWNTLIQGAGDTTSPSKPANLAFVHSTASSIYISWHSAYDNVSVAGYKIYRDGVYVGQTTETEFIDNRLSTNETYGYYISAFDYSGNESVYSNAISASTGTDSYAPSKPANLSVSSHTENTVSLSWVSSTDNVSVDGYNIYRDDKLIGSVRNKTTFTDQNAPGGLYTYFIRAFDNEGNLSIASEVTTVDNAPPSKPIITVDKISETVINLSWKSSDNSGNLTYDLYKNGTRIKTLTLDNTYSDYQVALNSQYTYYVIAYDAYKNTSEKSEICTVSTENDNTKPIVNSVTINSVNKIALVAVSASDNQALASVTVEYSTDKINWAATEPSLIDKTTTVKRAIPINYSEFADGLYYFRATATDINGNVSEFSESPVAEYTIDNTAPNTPFELSSDVTNGSIYIAWHYDISDTDIAYFRVFRMTGDNGVYTLIKDNYKYTSIYDNNFEIGNEYSYRITAVDNAGNDSPYSATNRATVAGDNVVPSVLSIYPTTGTKISSDFEMSVACFDNIKLKTLTVSVKRTDSDSWQTLSEIELDTYHKVTDIEIDTSSFATGEYEFKAIVTDVYGNESTAKSVVYDYKTNTLSVPALTAVGAGWRTELSWTMTNTEDIAGYYIYRRGLTETSFRQIAGVNRTTFTDNNVNAGEKYFYQIEAFDSYGNSTMSDDISVIPTHEDEIKPMASAGSNLLAVAGKSVTFDGSNSGDNNYVESYHWDFGDGSTSNSAVASHTYNSVGTYIATLTVTDSSSNSATDTITTTVYGSENDSFTIKTVSDNGTKLPKVNIICDEILGAGESCFTNSNGQYTFIAPSGTYTLYLYTDDYLPIKQIVNSNEDTTVTLTKKPIADGSITVTELDYNEIIALGIDPTDPDNRHVFKYTVDVTYSEGSNGSRTEIFRNAVGDLITNNSDSGFHETYSQDGVKLWEYHNDQLIYSHSSPGSESIKDIKLVAQMRITTDLTWLKGFYNVELTIINNADEDFYIDHALANITLPKGLSLANTTDTNDSTKLIGRIAGGETKIISWVVRGDESGSYDISAQFTGSLEPFGVPIDMEFKTEKPIEVEAGNALYFEVVNDLWSPSNDVWTIDYKLTNVGETTVYDIQFEILTSHVENADIEIKTMYIYHKDREGYDEVNWVNGKPDFENVLRWFNPLTEDIPDTTINLEPDEFLEFTVEVTKEQD